MKPLLKTLLLEDHSCHCEFKPSHRHVRTQWMILVAVATSISAIFWLMR
jgi:hypothetical protein